MPSDDETRKPEHRQLSHRQLKLGSASFLGALLLVLLWPKASRVEQPIRFNHEKHLGVGLGCTDCHTLFNSTQWAGLPTIDICLTCHSSAMTDSAEEEKIRTFQKQSLPLPWKQVNQLPTHLYFSHKTHAVSREIACTTCHGNMEKASVPPSKPFREWSMDTCLNCHIQNKATVDCDGCHR